MADCDKYIGLPSVYDSISNETHLTAPVSYDAEFFLYYHLEEKPPPHHVNSFDSL